MGPRTRKAVGTLLILAFMILYIAAAVWLADRIPARWWAQVPFYIIAGVGWGLPLRPLLSWMHAADDRY